MMLACDELTCDVLLMDAMFHFYTKDYSTETALLARLSKALKPQGLLVLAIVSTTRTMKALSELKKGPWNSWRLLVDTTARHNSSKALYQFLVIEKPA